MDQLSGGGSDFATQNGSKAVANAVEGQCRRSMAARKDAYAVYLSEQLKVGSGKLLPFDCDGDDRPDF